MTDHFGDRLVERIRQTKSFLCLGIDPHLELIPNLFDNNGKINNITKVEKFCYSLLDVAIKQIPAIRAMVAKMAIPQTITTSTLEIRLPGESQEKARSKNAMT